jgi:hypothetical protein
MVVIIVKVARVYEKARVLYGVVLLKRWQDILTSSSIRMKSSETRW